MASSQVSVNLLVCWLIENCLTVASPTHLLNSFSGDLLIVIAQIITAAQMVYEEKFVTRHNIPPLQAVGWEGKTWFGQLYKIHLVSLFAKLPKVSQGFVNPQLFLELQGSSVQSSWVCYWSQCTTWSLESPSVQIQMEGWKMPWTRSLKWETTTWSSLPRSVGCLPCSFDLGQKLGKEKEKKHFLTKMPRFVFR